MKLDIEVAKRYLILYILQQYLLFKVRTSTLSSQHRLLSDLHERLNNLESSVLGVDDKKVTKLRNELAKQIDLMRNQVSYEVPHKMKLVADAVEMLRKYPVDSGTTMNAVTNDDTLSKVKV